MTRVIRATVMWVLAAGVLVGTAGTAQAQAVHSLHLGAGLFAPRGYAPGQPTTCGWRT